MFISVTSLSYFPSLYVMWQFLIYIHWSFLLVIPHLLFWWRKWQPVPVLLPGKFQEWRSLVGYSSWGCKELDTTEQLHFLSIVPFGEENGNSLQCSCLENPMDRGAWWGCGLWGCKESDTTKQLTHTQNLFLVFELVKNMFQVYDLIFWYAYTIWNNCHSHLLNILHVYTQ